MNKVIEKELLKSIDNLLNYYYDGAEDEEGFQTFDYGALDDLMHKLMVRRKVLTMTEEEKKKK